MTILDEFVGRDGDWLSLSGAASVSPRGSSTAARFLYTDAQVTEFQTRMSGAGPFYSTGQGFDGAQTNAPGDGARALSHANDFLADPAASEWVQKVPMEENDAWPGGAGSGLTVDQAISPMRAAWCYMTLPNHANNAGWRSAVKDLLLFEANHPNHDFANSTNYPDNYPGYYSSPSFAVAGWMYRLLKAYDMLGRDSFTTDELVTLDKWFYTWANYVVSHAEITANNGRLPNLVDANWNVTGDLTVASWYNSMTSYRAYDGGDYISEFGWFTNRAFAWLNSGIQIANYLKFHGSVPDQSGEQPGYGWRSIDFILDYGRWIAEAWVRYSLHPDGWCYDFHRAQHGTAAPTQGWAYSANEIVGPLSWAATYAKRGVNTLWDISTTDGWVNTSGSPDTVAGITGFPTKTIRYGQWMHSRYMNDGWGRVVTTEEGTGPLTTSENFEDVLNAAIVSAQYPDDSLLMSSWKRVGNGFPGYPSSPAGQGSFNALDGEMGTYMGLIELGGV